METKHTSGPWTLKRNEHDLTGRKGLKGWDLIAQPSTTFPGAIECAGQYIGNEANACRIVECVNACEGLADPSVVPELLEALVAQKKWQSLQDAYNAIVLLADERDTRSVDDMDRAWDEFLDARIKADWLLDAAIAKATGKTL